MLRPLGIPKFIPQWAWELMVWHDRGKQGPRPPTAPRFVPVWYWLWRAWKLALRKLAQPKPPGGNPLWQSPGVMIQMWEPIDPTVFGQLMRQHGYKWAAILIHGDPNIRYDQLESFISRLRGEGIVVGGWGVLHNVPMPLTHAHIASQMCQRYGLSFYMGNGEKLYETMPELNGLFVREFRRLEPMLPLALSTEANLALDHKVWIDAGADIFPQTHTTENGTPPIYGYWSNVLRGWPKDRVHVAVSVGYGDVLVSPEHYRVLVDQARRLGMVGGYLYKGELLAGDGWPRYWTALV